MNNPSRWIRSPCSLLILRGIISIWLSKTRVSPKSLLLLALPKMPPKFTCAEINIPPSQTMPCRKRSERNLYHSRRIFSSCTSRKSQFRGHSQLTTTMLVTEVHSMTYHPWHRVEKFTRFRRNSLWEATKRTPPRRWCGAPTTVPWFWRPSLAGSSHSVSCSGHPLMNEGNSIRLRRPHPCDAWHVVRQTAKI